MTIINDDLMPDENLTQRLGRWGKHNVAIIKPDPSEMVGIAPVEWTNSNQDQIMEWMGASAETGISSWEQIGWEDDDDDEDNVDSMRREE